MGDQPAEERATHVTVAIALSTDGGSLHPLVVDVNDDIRCLILTYQWFELVAAPVQTSISSVDRAM